ncbi:MAG: T9SS type A sorting domain-containing protein [Flavobacteriales bacterium]
MNLGDCTVNTNFAAPINITFECLGPVPAPPNDEPCGAPSLGPLSGSCSSPVAGTTIGSTVTAVSSLGSLTPLDPAIGCGSGVNFGGAGGDVWYSIPVPATGLIGIQTTEASVCALGLGIYRANNCTDNPFQWVTGTATGLCSIDGLFGPQQAPGLVFDAFQFGLVAGDVVYVRVWERQRNEEGTFTICAYAPQRPTNNAPCGAIALSPSDPCTFTTYTTENSSPALTGITVTPALGCGNPGIPVNDLWFVVTVPATDNFTVTTTAGTLTDMAMAWYRLGSGDLCTPPATLTQIACNDNASVTNLMPRINSSTIAPVITPPLVAGEQIYVRVWNRRASQSNYWGTFGICVTPNTPPLNNDPCGAIPLEVGFDCALQPGTIENATASAVPAPSCGGSPVTRDIWYTVQVPLDLPVGEGLDFDTERYSNVDMTLSVYRATGSCPGALSLSQVLPLLQSCSVNGSTFGVFAMPRLIIDVPTIVPGELLYVRLSTTLVQQGDLGICVSRTDPQSCGGIVYDGGGPNGNYQNGVAFLETYCPTKPGDAVTLDFLQFNTEQGWDNLRIYNGTSTAAPLLGTWSGNNSPGTVTAIVNAGNPQGCLTVQFLPDGVDNAPGFAFKVSCAPFVTPPATVGQCGLLVYDPGGPNGPYAENIGLAGSPAFQQTYCPSAPGDVVTLNITSFITEAGFDQLWVFNGNTTATPLFNSGNGLGFGPTPFGAGAYWGEGGIGPFTSTHPSGCVTIYFQSDASISGPGWSGVVTCAPPPPPVVPVVGGGQSTTTACGSVFVDDGSAGNYGNFGSYPRTICPPTPGDQVQVTFLEFSVEASGPSSCWDALYVYDGPTVASPLINSGFTSTIWPPLPNPFGPGGYCGTNLPGPFTSSHPSGCLTFRFFSDDIITFPGWRAQIDCFTQPSNDNPCPAVTATPLPVSTACVPVSSTNVGATATTGVPQPGCGNYQGGDVWFRFTAPANGRVFIESFAGTLTDGVMALYSAAACPGPFTLVECNDDGGVGPMPRIDRLCNPLVGGQQYWLRFWGNTGQQGDFEICVRSRADETPLSDCLGAFTLCSDEPFSGANLGAGCFNDLDPANWGCLTGGERQGNWYAFSVQNPGTLGMAINPTGAMDLDWAVWGPFTPGFLDESVAATCTPTTPPIRCSNASLFRTQQASGFNATGMGNPNLALNTPRFAPPAPALFDGPLPTTDGWVPGINVSAGQVYLLFVDDHHLNGGSYSVLWDVTPTVIGTDVMNCTILPVELLTFDAKAQPAHVDVLWSTASERNSSHFMVQRSADGDNFLDIGRVAAAGNSVQTLDYGFMDEAPLEGLSYYRLKQVDVDGTSKLSEVVTVVYGPGQRGLELYPNPAVERVRVLFDMMKEGVVRWRITDASGRTADQGTTGGTKGRNGFDIELNKLEAGTYLLQLYDAQNGPIGQARFVKQH